MTWNVGALITMISLSANRESRQPVIDLTARPKTLSESRGPNVGWQRLASTDLVSEAYNGDSQ